ncbi:hypothetical protein [Azospirillum argentinense]|uniref:ParB/RepB/Spo0J family partition protein n=1 Tax=Azospirillum argentinense TaxID=2970906 RepID=UPI0032DF1649
MEPEQLYLDPRALTPNPWNTNVVSPENEAKLDASIQRLGVFKPIVVREVEGIHQIIGGEHRRDSAIRLGMDRVPVINLGPIADPLAKEISLADNARYGADDMLSLAGLLDELGNAHELTTFLPYTDTDLNAVFSSSSIALDALDYDETAGPDEPAEAPAPKAPKTHTVMRFKVPIEDAERLAALIQAAQKEQGFTAEDQLTNAGDALVHLLLGGTDA